MYLEKAEYLKKVYPIDDCISAITTTEVDHIPVGTPCIVYIKPFSTLTDKKSLFFREDRPKLTRKDKHTNIVVAKDLYNMDLAKANNLLYEHIDNVQTLFIFNAANSTIDYRVSNLEIGHIYFNGIKPIMIDNIGRYDLQRLSDVHSKNELDNFAEMTYESLRNNRYINYTFMDVAKSNQKYMMEDINTIFNSLRKTFTYNLSFFQSPADTIRNLIDIISISFYRLTDVTAIFDYKRSIGMGVEIFLTNALYKPKDMRVPSRSVTYRFLFSKSSEDVLTIDGERIHRLSMCPTDIVVNAVHDVISKNTPNDIVTKSKNK